MGLGWILGFHGFKPGLRKLLPPSLPLIIGCLQELSLCRAPIVPRVEIRVAVEIGVL